MKVLIISAETWRDDKNGGNVLSNIFNNTNFEFAQIYCNPGNPSNKLCKNYFQLTDTMIINSFFSKNNKIGNKIMSNDGVAGVSFLQTTYNSFSEMMKSMDTVVIVLVFSAGLLAFIVLYNLNNINIAERRRELATFKVLGFYDMEVSGYIYRENVIITILGIIIGIGFGIILHQFVIQTAEIDMVMFGRNIGTRGYIYSTLLTILFAVIINISMHFKLKKVDMATSLKSGE